MKRALRWSVLGAGCCAAVAAVTVLLTSPSDQPSRALTVPQAEDLGPEEPRRPPSSVSVALPSPPIETQPTTPPTHHSELRPPPSSPRPKPPPPPKFASTELQAENARIRNGQVDSNHAGFTGTGFVNYDNVPGGSVEWTVTASAITNAEIIFRFANGSSNPRFVDVTVNGILVRSVAFPATNGWSDWRTLAVSSNFLGGTNTIKATARSQDGGPNIDKINLL